MDLTYWHTRARERGVNPVVYWVMRARGESVLIFPEGTRIRPGALGKPKRGVGRLASETGAPVAEAVASVPLLAARLEDAGVDAPVPRGLAGIVEGRIEPAGWTASLTAPRAVKSAQTAKAA
jgi:glycerol-3-phosphate dehydrogenase (NAD(P)+)